MSDDFNPYHKWLGIPLSEQPADYYRLLGIARFEGDLDVITGASDQRMQFLRTMQTGKRGKLVDKLLNEIANAKVCLLNKEKKAAYDQKLRKPEATEAASKPELLFEADAEPRNSRNSRNKRRGNTSRPSRRNTASRRDNATDDAADKPPRGTLIIAIPVIVLIAILITGVMLFTSSQNAKKEAAQKAAIAKKETERKAQKEADRKAEAEREKHTEAERKLKAETDRIVKTEADADRKAQEESEQRVKQAEQRARIAEQRLRRAEALNAARAREKAMLQARQRAAQATARKKAEEAASVPTNIRPENSPTKPNEATAKERAGAIELLEEEGLFKGKKGWIPEEMGQRLMKFEKEVAFLKKKGFTPEQVQQIDELKNSYYQKRFAEWQKLHEKGLTLATGRGLEPGSWWLPTNAEAEKHRYLDRHLLAKQFRGEKPQIMPDAVMQEKATTAALKYLTKQNPRYLMTADVQRKKKLRQIKTMEKKIRMRIRDLQKKPEIEQALNTLDSKLDPRFLSTKNK